MRVYLYRDELWPFYGIDQSDPDPEYIREVHGRTVNRWKRVLAEFHKVQREMGEVIERGATP